MSDPIWLSEVQMRRIEPYFPLWHGIPRVDDGRVILRTRLEHGVPAPELFFNRESIAS